MMKLILTIFLFMSLGTSFAQENSFPKSTSLTSRNLECEKDNYFRCLTSSLENYGSLHYVDPEKSQIEIQNDPKNERYARLMVNGEEYLRFSRHGKSYEELTKILKEKIDLVKGNEKRKLLIPKLTGNSKFFIGSPAYHFSLPVFDGPSMEEREKFKEVLKKEELEAEVAKLKKELKQLDWVKRERDSYKEENSRLRGRLRLLASDKEECEATLNIQKTSTVDQLRRDVKPIIDDVRPRLTPEDPSTLSR